ncbi:MAG: single-stranded-DNA-specific exonuclease RecJ [Parcubacteria group bacterium]|nr:single-stranded-DNA-specific exonuclease RecJ [Parcubacteria group bacterium]
MHQKTYRMADVPNDEVREVLSEYSPLVQTLLLRRGILTSEDAERFLRPDWERDTHDPFLLTDMEKAVERIFSAIDAEEHIVIYGDYDADGIPASVILHDFFVKVKYPHFSNYMPHRHNEGFGLNTEAIEEFANRNVSLIVTVDCGIADTEPIAHARELGMDVIVTDHHIPGESLPDAYAIVDPKRSDDTYPDDMLCGAGLAFKLAHALLIRGRESGRFDVPEEWEKWLLDMVGVATIADMVPLVKENRVLAYFGLKVLQKGVRLGIRALCSSAKCAHETLTEGDVGFTIGPRINAASRMDHPDVAFRLLSAINQGDAEEAATHLENLNNERKTLVATMMRQIHKKIDTDALPDVIVLGDPSWRVGVLGIAANKLMEEYGRPVFLWGREGAEKIRGSARSDGSVDVVELMRALPEGVLPESGGHAEAGGFEVAFDAVHTLGEELNKAYREVRRDILEEEVVIDAVLSIDDIHERTFHDMNQLAPFGMRNPKPLFWFRDVTISDVSVFGKGKEHLKLTFHNSRGGAIDAIAFFTLPNAYGDELTPGMTINMIATMEQSFFRNRLELRLRIEDVKVQMPNEK